MDLEKRINLKYPLSHFLPSKMAKNVIGVILSASFISSCSQIPDAINPAEWYRGTLEFFSEDDAKTFQNSKKSKLGDLLADQEKSPPGSEESFPNLASVDKQARARDVTRRGLPADVERPKYAPSINRQEVASINILEPTRPVTKPISRPKPIPVLPLKESTEPAPQAMPKPFVAQTLAPSKPKTENYAPLQKIAQPEVIKGQEEVQKRMVRQLAEIRSRSSSRVAAPILIKSFSSGKNKLSTIVVSSKGVTVNQTGAKLAQFPVLADPSTGLNSSSRLTIRPSGILGNEVKVATIFYDNGSYKLRANDKKILDAVARLQNKEGGQFRIVGHASSRTRNLTPVKHKMVNFKISIDRADEIASTLVQLGVNKKNIQVAAVSDTQPAYYEFMMSGEAGNRRTEIYLTR